MREEERALHEEKAVMGDDMECEQGEQEAPVGGCDQVRGHRVDRKSMATPGQQLE
jgi:hypothetical protein